MIIAVTGMPLAGKGVVASMLEQRGYPRVLMSAVLKEEMARRKITIDYDSILEFATNLRRERGNGAVAELCVPYFDKLLKKSAVVVLDGVRSPDEITVMKKKYGDDFVLIAVTATFSNRFKRLGREDHAETEASNVEELENRDEKELSFGLGRVIESADHIIENDGTFESYKRKIDSLFAELGI